MDSQEIVLEARIENLNEVLKFVDSYLLEAGCPMDEKTQLDMVVDELYSNICFYAYPKSEEKPLVRVRMETEEEGSNKCFHLTFMDRGVPYNPLLKKDPDVTLPPENRKIGGLGIYIVKQMMDHISYDRDGDRNVLKLIKCVK